MDDDSWLRIKIKMLRHGVTFQSVADYHQVKRQWVWKVIKKGYPATGKTKAILDDFYGRLND